MTIDPSASHSAEASGRGQSYLGEVGRRAAECLQDSVEPVIGVDPATDPASWRPIPRQSISTATRSKS
jgi:hypothetical protein